MPVVSLNQLLESGVHFGHQTRRWNPKMEPYIFTDRNGVHIIDLVQTAQCIEEAYAYLRQASEQGKKVLFVGTKRQAAGIVAQEALRCGSYYVNQRWLGGMLTNWVTIKTRVDRLKDMEKLRKYLGGIKLMRKLPDIVIIVDQKREYNAVQECQKLNIPIVALLDTNCDPDLVDIGIPANDDAIRSIKLIVSTLANAIYEGRHGQVDVEAEDFEDIPYAEDEEAYVAEDAEDVVDDEEEASE